MTGVTCVFDANNHLGESPFWSPAEQALWWVNCEHPPELWRWVPETGERQSWSMPSRIGGFVFKAAGGLLVALADGVYDFEPDSGHFELRAPSPLPSHVTLHECACDRQGRFWVGAFDHRFPADRSAAGGAFFRLDGDVLVPVIPDIAVANGLAFSPDGRTVYAASTPQRNVQAFDLDPDTGEISNGRIFLSLPPSGGHIDGATVDADGGYWLAVVAKGVIRRYRPDGLIDREIALPCSNPTKPAFGGVDLETIFMTSTQMLIDPSAPGAAANGGIFATRPGFQGVPETPFAD